MTVEDHVSGVFQHAEARFHVHPAVNLDQNSLAAGGASVTLRLPGGQFARFVVESGRLRTEVTTWHPEFGRTVPNMCLVVDLDNALARIHLDWDQAS